MVAPMWPPLVQEAGQKFVDQPPAEIGEVVGAWTNNTASGLKPVPVTLRLLSLAIGACGGFVVGLVGFFVYAGIKEKHGTHIEGSWFLYALAAGAALGMLLALPSALRKPEILTMFVGTEGCVQIASGKHHPLLFRDVTAMRDKVSTMRAKGIATSAREIYVRDARGRERLWWISKASDDAKRDAQYQFGQAAMVAFAAYRQRAEG